MLAKEFPNNFNNVFNPFEVKKLAGYNMIKPDALLCNYHNSNMETCRQKYKITSVKVRKVDHLLENDLPGLEAKALP